MGSMKDRLDEDHAAAWKPEPGDELIGKVVDLGQRTTEWGTYPIVTVKPEDGPALAFHAYHTVAKDALAGAYPSIGCEIGIRYFGKVTGEKFSYQKYKIVVDHPEGWTPPLLVAPESAGPGPIPESVPEDEVPF